MTDMILSLPPRLVKQGVQSGSLFGSREIRTIQDKEATQLGFVLGDEIFLAADSTLDWTPANPCSHILDTAADENIELYRDGKCSGQLADGFVSGYPIASMAEILELSSERRA